MNGDRPDPLVRLDTTTAAVDDLRDIFAAEEPLDDVLVRVAVTAARVIPDADAVTITVLTDGEPRTAAFTDDRVVAVDKEQYAAGRGPSLAAASSGRPLRAVVGEHRDEWPEFVSAAELAGVRAFLSVPLLIEANADVPELVGTLNIYSYTTAAFDPFDEGLMRLFGSAASAAVSNARRWQLSRENVTQLETALNSRAEIDQAKGVLMAVHGCTAEAAFTMLVEESQRRNTKLRQVATDFLASVRRGFGNGTAPA